ncbi:MAG: ABC transporter substrate-binding protein [Chloroflexi bacterium]|nr:ABC transporter substrate-binding protein [Chloroflexota bacterium]
MASSNLLRIGLALGIALVLLVVSCAPAAEPTAAPTAPPPTTAPAVQPTSAPPTPTPVPSGERPRRGGQVIRGNVSGFGLASWEECCSMYAKATNDSILTYIPSNKPFGGDEEIGPRMAYDWSISKDGLSWTFKLEPGMKAAIPAKDGGGFEVVDCDDVAWSITTIKSGEGLRRTMRGRTLVPLTGVECPDPLTAVVKTKWPYAALPGMMAVSINDIKPKDYWQTRLKDLRIWTAGSGPWMLQEFIGGERASMVPNPYYHRKAPDGKPYPYLDRVELIDQTPDACSAALRTGRVHMCYDGILKFWNKPDTIYQEAKHLQFLGAWRIEDNPGWGTKGMLGDNSSFLMAHHGKAPWNKVRIREALSLALDRRAICRLAMDDWCQPGGFIFIVGTTWNLPKEQVWSYPGYNLDTVEENIAKARKILQEEGFALYPDPKALFIDHTGFSTTCVAIQPVVVEMLRRAGFNPNYYCPEAQRSLAQVVSGEFDVTEWDQLVAHPDPNQVCYEHYFTGSDRNYGRYSNAKADDLCHKMGQELDRTKRVTLAHEYHKLIMDDHARANIAWFAGAYALHPDIRGIKVSSFRAGGSHDRMEDWWRAK